VGQVYKWTGSDWTTISEFTAGKYGTPDICALADYGGYLYAGGEFTDSPNRVGEASGCYDHIPDLHVRGIARWNGTTWQEIDTDHSVNGGVRAIAIMGSDVYTGGYFTEAGGSPARHIVKWNGTSWTEPGNGISGHAWHWPAILALTSHGSDLYVGGVFNDAGSTPAENIVKWNSGWSALGPGLPDDWVSSLATDGSNVYAGRANTPPNYIVQWNGSSWSPLGGDVSGSYPSVYAVALSGGNLYVGGNFSQAGSTPAGNIVRWDGANWWNMGGGVNDNVYTIAVDGSDVYVGGDFTLAGLFSANYVARWDGATWHALGTGLNGRVNTIAVDGSDVYVGGTFTTAGGLSANYIARWDGSAWHPMGSGMDSHVYAIAVTANYIYAGGEFKYAGGKPSNYFARWYKGIAPADLTLIKVPHDYSTIQQAIDVATNGDTIMVDPGDYYINAAILNDHVNDLLILGSRDEDGQNASIIKANASPGTYPCVRFNNVTGCTFTGFEIMDGSHGIIFDNCTDCEAVRNYIHDIDATADDGIGIAVWNSTQIRVDSCVVDQCEMHGIALWQSTYVDMDHNTILQSRNNDGLSIAGTSDHVTATNSIFGYNNEQGIETNGLTFTSFDHHHNCFWQNGLGSISGHTLGAASMETDPLLVHIAYRNYFLQSGSPCLGSGESGSDIGAMEEWTHTPANLYVPSMYTTIQDAIDAAMYSDTIHVDPSTYPITSSIINDHVCNLHFRGSRQEDGSNSSIITTSLTPGTTIMFRFFNVHGCTISGFEIENGSEGLVFDQCTECECTETYIHDNDVGMGIWNSSDIEVSYSIFDNNDTRALGLWTSENVIIDHNTVLGSQNNEGMSIGGASDHLTIENNIFAFNNEEGVDTQGLTFMDFVHDYNLFYQNPGGSISGHTIGTHSLVADPLLQDMDNENFYLQTGSPCLGTGESGSDIGALGVWTGGTDVNNESTETITEFTLHQNYPNPFNPETVIPYSIPKASHVELSIFNLRGEKITTLINGQKTTGHYKVEWNGKDMAGKQVSSGIYLYRLETESFVQTKKMLFVR
jgi:hypothetical protein